MQGMQSPFQVSLDQHPGPSKWGARRKGGWESRVPTQVQAENLPRALLMDLDEEDSPLGLASALSIPSHPCVSLPILMDLGAGPVKLEMGTAFPAYGLDFKALMKAVQEAASKVNVALVLNGTSRKSFERFGVHNYFVLVCRRAKLATFNLKKSSSGNSRDSRPSMYAPDKSSTCGAAIKFRLHTTWTDSKERGDYYYISQICNDHRDDGHTTQKQALHTRAGKQVRPAPESTEADHQRQVLAPIKRQRVGLQLPVTMDTVQYALVRPGIPQSYTNFAPGNDFQHQSHHASSNGVDETDGEINDHLFLHADADPRHDHTPQLHPVHMLPHFTPSFFPHNPGATFFPGAFSQSWGDSPEFSHPHRS
eukprot:TRINITY_DN1906_c0_g1_i1.p2 TRINITY_DN1906_c0_g1~~TRINITY_DN1906_c0_g1_i1.p2  ORF type:complete len:365 (-),score=44.39 TRINITY_DN1906_c0_g1_i1:8-1102(-)